MNLFVLSESPFEAAEMLDDKRLGSALMEANHMMSIAVKEHDASLSWSEGEGMLVRGWSHRNHPVTRWVGLTNGNFHWCLVYAEAVYKEILYRRGTEHGSYQRTEYIRKFSTCIPKGPQLPFQNSARNAGYGLDFSYLPVVEAYRKYLAQRFKTDKRPPTYTNRGFPEWVA